MKIGEIVDHISYGSGMILDRVGHLLMVSFNYPYGLKTVTENTVTHAGALHG